MIYLDNHATTAVDPRVLKSMLPYFNRHFGNAASRLHAYGKKAEQAVQKARQEVADLIQADSREIIFTSGATESNNLAIKGAVLANRKKGRRLITLATEHKSVLDPCKRLAMEGFEVSYLPVKSDGLLDMQVLRKAIRRNTVLISVMLANNEIGVLQPISQIGALARKKGILFHCDASQALGKIPIDVKKMRVDLLSVTAHKLYGPKGVGALFVRKTKPWINLIPQMDGGGHETGLRSGTLNVSAIVGFGEACRIAGESMQKESRFIGNLRNALWDGLKREVPDCILNGHPTERLYNNLNVSFEGIDSDQLIKKLPSVAFSTGSACLSTSHEKSYVLKAIGVREDLRRGSVRFGLGRFNTLAEIKETIGLVSEAVRSLRMKETVVS